MVRCPVAFCKMHDDVRDICAHFNLHPKDEREVSHSSSINICFFCAMASPLGAIHSCPEADALRREEQSGLEPTPTTQETESRTKRSPSSPPRPAVLPDAKTAELPDACPFPSCAFPASSMLSWAAVTAHLRNTHRGLELPSGVAQRLGLKRCTSHCKNYFRGNMRNHKCRAKQPASVALSSNSSSSSSSSAPRPRLIKPSAPPALPSHPQTWLFGEPESSPGCSSWFFVPLIRCALGLAEHGGMAQTSAGEALWTDLRDHYAAHFANEHISASSITIMANGYIDATTQQNLLLGPESGGKSNIDDKIEAMLQAHVIKMQNMFAKKSAPHGRESKHSRPPRTDSPEPEHGNHGELSLTQVGDQADDPPERKRPPQPDPDPDLDGDIARLSHEDIAEHGRLWQLIPNGCDDHWRTAARPRWHALLSAHAADDKRALGQRLTASLCCHPRPSSALVVDGGARATPSALGFGPSRRHVVLSCLASCRLVRACVLL